MTGLMPLVKLIRPQQWVKNSFVFLPMFFSGNLLNREAWWLCIIAFFSFSFTASAIYCLNDIKDVEADRMHPKKRSRPLASGDVTIVQAVVLLVLLLGAGLTMAALLLPVEAVLLVAFYFILNVAYCFRLKQIAIVDVFIVSFGFVLRVIVGGVSCNIWVSPWLICMTFLIALFLAFAKRRDDVVMMETEGILVRKNIVRYNSDFLNQTLGLIAAITIMCYIIYTVSPEVVSRFACDYVYITAIFVLAAILRYLQVALVDRRSGSPTKILLHDRFIQASIAGWLLTFVVIIYL